MSRSNSLRIVRFHSPVVAVALTLMLAVSVLAQDQATEPKGEKPSGAPVVELNDLEKKFRDSLKSAVFEGRWSLRRGDKLSPEKDEKYTIHSASKLGGERWLIHARIQYGQKDVTVPIPVNVRWAGDTPVISIDSLWIPGVGTYSARVLVYDGSYAGTWSGPDYGGLLNGLIKHPEEGASPEKQ